MFRSFDENTFNQAIKDKNYLTLKTIASCTMLADPTFERGEAEQVLSILKEKTPEIFEDYVQLDYEERLDRSVWNKGYFTELTYWFQKNFALERVEYIKEVGRAVHQDTAEKYAQSMAVKPQKQKSSQSPKTAATDPKRGKAQGNTSKNFPLARAIVAAAALVLAIVLLIKYLTK